MTLGCCPSEDMHRTAASIAVYSDGIRSLVDGRFGPDAVAPQSALSYEIHRVERERGDGREHFFLCTWMLL